MKKGFVNRLWVIFVGLGLVGSYFFSRLINLTIIPIFTDEAIYLRWAQIALADPRWRFISLIDGKQPLFIWLLLPVLKVVNDPLLAGRILSVVVGFSGLIGMVALGWYVSRKVYGGLLGGLFYVLIPFFLTYDRMALYDGLVCALTIWTIFLSYLFAKKQQLGFALLLGSIIGAGLLTKSMANFFWILLPATLLLVPWPKKNRLRVLGKWVGLSLVVIIQSQIYNNILRLSEFRHIIGEKNLSFIYSFSEFFHAPFQSVFGNLQGLGSWFISYLTIPLTLLIIISSLWFVKRNWREGIFFLSYFAVPFMALAFFGKVIYPRFILFMLPPLLILTIQFILYAWKKVSHKLALMIVIVIIAPLLFFDLKIITDPIHAPFPYADKQQFINDWPAGYGIAEVVSYLSDASKQGSIIVGTEGTFGLFPMALELYLGKNPNVTFDAIWPIGADFPKELIESAQHKPTFILFKEKQIIPTGWPIQLIKQYERGDGPTYLKFYRVLPKS